MKASLFGALFLLLLLGAPALARDNYPRVNALDAIRYSINLQISDANDEIRGETEIVFLVRADGVSEVPLDFGDLMVDSAMVNHHDDIYKEIPFRKLEGRLIVTLEHPYRRGDSIFLRIKYHGSPSDGLFFKRNKFGDRTIFADNWPNRAHNWFPSIDHPYDKARVEFTVTAPARYDVVANGKLVETKITTDGMKLTRWREGVPIPVYCMVIGVTEFSILPAGVSGVTPLTFYLYPKDRDTGTRDYGRALKMLDFFTTLIGPYPYEKLALVQSSTRFGGMENSSSIFFDEKAYDGSGRLEGTVAHEIAHQWFGDSVTESDWNHLWLSEGFATYFGALFFEHTEGRDAFVRRMLTSKERYLKDAAATSRPIHDDSVTDLFKLLNRNNYEKGAWVLHMLRRLMGDEKFFAGVRDYYRTYRDRIALTEDFRRVMEARAGRSLSWFFDEWIYRPGYPNYEADWRWSKETKQLRLRVRQTQVGAPFRMPLDVEIRTGDASRRELINVSGHEQLFTFKLKSKPQSVAIDPDEWVLKTLKISEE